MFWLSLPRGDSTLARALRYVRRCFAVLIKGIRKLAFKHSVPEERLCEVLPKNMILYTTMEPCNKRQSGKMPCVDRILRLKDCIRVVYCGIKEPENFIEQTVLVVGRKRLAETGVEVIFIDGMEDQILAVALSGHES